jgi:hypothetical protein
MGEFRPVVPSRQSGQTRGPVQSSRRSSLLGWECRARPSGRNRDAARRARFAFIGLDDFAAFRGWQEGVVDRLGRFTGCSKHLQNWLPGASTQTYSAVEPGDPRPCTFGGPSPGAIGSRSPTRFRRPACAPARSRRWHAGVNGRVFWNLHDGFFCIFEL